MLSDLLRVPQREVVLLYGSVSEMLLQELGRERVIRSTRDNPFAGWLAASFGEMLPLFLVKVGVDPHQVRESEAVDQMALWSKVVFTLGSEYQTWREMNGDQHQALAG